MRWNNLFDIYNKKLAKNKKLLTIITTLSIFLSVIISLAVPQISYHTRQYLEDNIKDINGGDLTVYLEKDYDNKDFFNELEKMKSEGLSVNTVYSSKASYISGSNKIMTSAVVGDYNIKDNEVIIGETLAKNSKLKKGDTISLKLKGSDKKEYIIKDIEYQAKGVSNDTALFGYVKINNSDNIYTSQFGKIVYISGDDGKKLCDRLKNIDKDKYSSSYSTLDDKYNKLQDNQALEETSLGILSIVTYILAILCIVSTISMIVLQRKKDIAILRMLSVNRADIKKSIIFELSRWFIPVIILAGILSYPLSRVMLSFKGIEGLQIISWDIIFIIKNLSFNIAILFLVIMIPLKLISYMNPVSILNNNSDELRKKFKSILLKSILIIPIVITAYCFVSSNMGAIIGLIILVLFSLIFIVSSVILIKLIIRLIPMKFFNLRYTFKSIKQNLFGFILVLVSITMTLWFVLIGFYLKSSINDNMEKSLKDALPYNYIVYADDENEFEQEMSDNKSVEGYDKFYYTSGKINNLGKETPYSRIGIYETDQDKYTAKFNIIEGQNLYEGDQSGVIISDKMSNSCNVNVNDILEVSTKTDNLKLRVKGIYKSSGINDIGVYKEGNELGGKVEYYLKAEDISFSNKLNDLEIYNLSDSADVLTSQFTQFLTMFKILSFVTIISALLFNINIMSMNNSLEEKDETIIKVLGNGRSFIRKSKNTKIIIMTVLASLLSAGMYSVIMNLMFKSMFNCNADLSVVSIISLCIMAFIISFIAFSKNTVTKRIKLNLLRND